MKRTTIVLFILLASAMCSGAQDGITRIIKKGDTIYSLSREYNVPVDLILKANGLEDGRLLKPGQKLVIPSTYTVAKGDTLYSISRKSGASVDAIRTANGFTASSVLKEGQTLFIPVEETQVAKKPGGTAASAPVDPQNSASSVTKDPATAGVKDPATAAANDPATIAAKDPATAGVKDPATAGVKDPATAGVKDPATAGVKDPAKAGVKDPAKAAAKDPATAGVKDPAKAAAKDPASKPDKPGDGTGPAKVVVEGAGTSVAGTGASASGPWPVKGVIQYIQGKLFGITISGESGDKVVSVASGTVVSAGPYRGYGRVVFVQAPNGYIYVYGGNEGLSVHVGDAIHPGDAIGTVALDPREKKPLAYFFVYKDNKAIDPAKAPRG
jgi:murein DD-endopeptidase MepM/ murein hydrolase activator NlpD